MSRCLRRTRSNRINHDLTSHLAWARMQRGGQRGGSAQPRATFPCAASRMFAAVRHPQKLSVPARLAQGRLAPTLAHAAVPSLTPHHRPVDRNKSFDHLITAPSPTTLPHPPPPLTTTFHHPAAHCKSRQSRANPCKHSKVAQKMSVVGLDFGTQNAVIVSIRSHAVKSKEDTR